MIRFLNYVGLFALTALCVAQWRINLGLNHEVSRLERIRQELSEKLDDRDDTVSDQADDLNKLRERITELTGDLRQLEAELSAASEKAISAESQIERYKENAQAWKDAVADRDEHIRESNARIADMVGEYNALAENYKKLSDELNERVEEYNRLLRKK